MRRPPTIPGFSHGDRTESCPDCLTNDRPGGQPGCETCGGSGRVRSDNRDPMQNPGTTVARIVGEERQAQRDQAAARDRELSRLRLLLDSEAAGVEGDVFTRAVEARDRLYAAGDYGQLERALAWFRDVNAPAHGLVWEALIYAPWGTPPELSRRLTISVELIAARLEQLVAPREIRVPSWIAAAPAEFRLLRKDSLWRGRTNAHDRQRQERDAEIVRVHRELGVTVAELELAHGLSRSTVYEILGRAHEAKAEREVCR
jgi:hypothetical protein